MTIFNSYVKLREGTINSRYHFTGAGGLPGGQAAAAALRPRQGHRGQGAAPGAAPGEDEPIRGTAAAKNPMGQ